MRSICPTCGKDIDVPNIQTTDAQSSNPTIQTPTTSRKKSLSTQILSFVFSVAIMTLVLVLFGTCGRFIGRRAAEVSNASAFSAQPEPQTSVGVSETDFDSLLPEMISKLNRSMPMTVDRDTRADRVSAGPGRKVTYHYSLTRYRIGDFDRDKLIAALRENLIRAYKVRKDLKMYRDNNVVIDYSYADADGIHFATISVGPDDLH